MAALERMPSLADCRWEGMPTAGELLGEAVPTALGTRLRELRRQGGWGYVELAHYLGLQPKTYSRYERNRTVPSPRMLHALADTLGCAVDQLYPMPVEVAA